MTAKEILLKHVNRGASKTVKKLNEIVNWDIFIEAMEEYANQEYQRGIEDGKIIQEHGSTHWIE